jgi:tetratricopeptide (TPR) repeat protein
VPRAHYPDLGKDIQAISFSGTESEKEFIAVSFRLIQKWQKSVGINNMPRHLFITIGQTALKRNNTKVADVAFDKALILKPGCHVSMIGKADCALQMGKLDSAIEWTGKAYSNTPNTHTAMKFLGVLYTARKFKLVEEVIEPLVEEALDLETSSSSFFLGMSLATRDNKDQKFWIDFFTKNNSYKNIPNIINQAVQISKKFQAMHDAPKIEETYVDDYEKAAMTGSREGRRLARKMIDAYSKGGFVWETLHERIAASCNVADAVGTMGFVSKHQPTPLKVAASSVRRVVLG